MYPCMNCFSVTFCSVMLNRLIVCNDLEMAGKKKNDKIMFFWKLKYHDVILGMIEHFCENLKKVEKLTLKVVKLKCVNCIKQSAHLLVTM